MTISVIIPIYKVEQYLNECLQSVFAQTYKDLEIILVDDGSPDNCPQLCDDYAKDDNRIKVIHKTNGGLSDARNAGLREATGDYVIFLDSDDYWLDNRLIEALIDECKKEDNIDIVLFHRKDYYESTKKWISGKPYKIECINNKTRNEIFKYLLLNKQFNMSACFQIIRRELLIKNNLFFEKSQLSEDIDWSLRMWLYIDKIRVVNIEGYAYRHRPESITTSYDIKHAANFAAVLDKWFNLIRKENIIKDEELSNLYLGYLSYLYPTLIRNYFLIQKKDRKIEYQLLKSLQSLINYGITAKSNQLKKVHSCLGFRFTCIVFGLYGVFSKKGLAGLKNLIIGR